jgi:hypothetical protein
MASSSAEDFSPCGHPAHHHYRRVKFAPAFPQGEKRVRKAQTSDSASAKTKPKPAVRTVE